MQVTRGTNDGDTFGGFEYNGYLYALGGRPSATLKTVEYAQIQTDGQLGAWTYTSPMQQTRWAPLAFAYGGYAYVCGGGTGAQSTLTSCEYTSIKDDGSLNAWQPTSDPSINFSLGTGSGFVANGYAYLMHSVNNANSSVGDDSYSYAPVNSDGSLSTWKHALWTGNAIQSAANNIAGGLAHGPGGSFLYNNMVYTFFTGGSTVETQVWYAPFKDDGSIGTFVQTTSFPNWFWGAGIFADNGFAYVINSVPAKTWATMPTKQTFYAPINDDGSLGAWSETTSTLTAGSRTALPYHGYVYAYYDNGTVEYAHLGSAAIKGSAPSSCTPASGDLGGWSTGTSMSAIRWAHATVAYNGYIYAIGGRDSGANFLKTVEYAPIGSDGSLSAWMPTSSLKTAQANPEAFAYNGYMYVAGGIGQKTTEYAPINADGSLGAWTITSSLVQARDHFLGFADNGYAYAIGGCADTGGCPSGPTETMERATINDDGTLSAWNLLSSSLLKAEWGADGFLYNGYVYMLGGSSGATTQYAPMNSDGTIGTWVATSSMSTPHLVGAAFSYNGSAYALGGQLGGVGTKTIESAPINSDGSLGTWSALGGLATARDQFGEGAAVIYNNYLYMVGGQSTTYLASTEYAALPAVPAGCGVVVPPVVPLGPKPIPPSNVYGQAYSENIGWINFSCDGAGDSDPHDTGVQSVPNGLCDTMAYGVQAVSADKGVTWTLSGSAYSTNGGWLSMDGLTIDATGQVQGTTNAGNFGITSFAGNSSYPGLKWNSQTGLFSGYAYSEKFGWINFSGAGYNVILDFGFVFPPNARYIHGQVYSENVGWINLFCDGAGDTHPYKAGVQAITNDFCTTTPYGVIATTPDNGTTWTLSGYGYSTDAGWFDMDGLTIDASGKVQGSTTYGNFGKTTFTGSPLPNLTWDKHSGSFGGVAYSEQLGWINFSGVGYGAILDYNYGVSITPPPTPFAAVDTRTLTFNIMDVGDSDLATSVASVTDASGIIQTTSAAYPAGSTTGVVSFPNLDVRRAGVYTVTLKVCDIAGNCTPDGYSFPFFHVVANVPTATAADCASPAENFAVACPSALTYSTGTVVADATQEHTTSLQLADKYGNRVRSEKSSPLPDYPGPVKEVGATIDFTNSTKLDQIAGTGDSIVYMNAPTENGFTLHQVGGATTGALHEADVGDTAGAGRFDIGIQSYAPTSTGYSPIRDDGFKVQLNDATYAVTSCYAGSGETVIGAQPSFGCTATSAWTPPLTNNFGTTVSVGSSLNSPSNNPPPPPPSPSFNPNILNLLVSVDNSMALYTSNANGDALNPIGSLVAGCSGLCVTNATRVDSSADNNSTSWQYAMSVPVTQNPMYLLARVTGDYASNGVSISANGSCLVPVGGYIGTPGYLSSHWYRSGCWYSTELNKTDSVLFSVPVQQN